MIEEEEKKGVYGTELVTVKFFLTRFNKITCEVI